MSGLFGGGLFAWVFLYLAINNAPAIIPDFVVALVRQPDLLEFPKAKRCSECHEQIFENWKKSRHSQAWISKNYIKDSENRSKEKCLACHIPVEVHPETKPDPRLKEREEGIFCVPCHVHDKTMNGPYELFSPPHPTRKNPDYRKSNFCGACHQKTFKEWQVTGTEKTCQECHMPHSKERLVQKFPLHFLHSKKNVADHSFPVGEIKEEDLIVLARWTNDKIVVTLKNQSIPHHLPTADNGDPRLYLYVLLSDASEEEMDQFKEIFSPQQETALPYGKTIQFDFQTPKPTRQVEVLIKYKSAWSDERKVIRRLILPH